MDKKTLEALRGSVRKWESIAEGIGINAGSENCPLCHLFHPLFKEEADICSSSCDGCPVYDVWIGGCYGTPFRDWIDHMGYHGRGLPEQDIPYTRNYHNAQFCLCPECHRIAEREVEFLKSLLPGWEEHVKKVVIPEIKKWCPDQEAR